MELLLDVSLISVNSQIKLYFKKGKARFSHPCASLFHAIPFDFHMIHIHAHPKENPVPFPEPFLTILES